MTADTGAFLSLHHRWLGLSCLDEAKTSTAAFGIRVCETVQWHFHVKCLYFEKCLLVFVTDPFFIFSTRAQHRLLFKLSTHGDHLFVPSLLFSLHFIKNWKCWRVCVCVCGAAHGCYMLVSVRNHCSLIITAFLSSTRGHVQLVSQQKEQSERFVLTADWCLHAAPDNHQTGCETRSRRYSNWHISPHKGP